MSGMSWTECRTHDYYPVIGISFPQGVLRAVNEMLFDSGSDESYVSATVIDREALDVQDAAPHSGTLNGRPLYFYELDVSLMLHDGETTRVGNTCVTVVENWESSALTAGCAKKDCEPLADGRHNPCPPRSGIVSTRVLADLETSVLLDGRERRLKLVSLGERSWSYG